MRKHTLRNITLSISLSFISTLTFAQKVKEPAKHDPDWSKPYQPFRIAGNLYYVGTYDLSSYLIVTSQGNILINTGLAASASMIRKNIEALGFKFSDIKILLTTQAHYDHMGAMATIKKQTGAQLMADDKEVDVLADGGNSDYALGGHGSLYAPVKADRLLHDGDTIQLGDTKLVMLHHPGHTKGSCSFLFNTKDEQRSYRVLIANMPTIVTDKKFTDIPAYPTIAQDYTYTLSAMKKLSFDLWVASHASQFQLHSKHKPGDKYNPSVFMNRKEYDEALNELQKKLDEKLKEN
ncbi:MAG: subclass B3 metallo-beta-lactamase [Chitinophagaceae bacterium]